MNTPTSDWVIETSVEGFEQDVLVASQDVPVVVDFWAPSCQPCLQLTPILETLAGEFAGRFRLVKVNIDECQELATAFTVESIPLVVAFQAGQPVDSFMGLQPEESIREWLGQFVPSEAEALFAEAESLEADDPAGAEERYRRVAELDPTSTPVLIGLARVLQARGGSEEAREIIAGLEARGIMPPEVQAIKDQLDLESSASESGGVTEARQTAEATPGDPQLQLKLADTLAAEGQYEEAFEICLGLVESDTGDSGAQAKDRLVTFFGLPGAPPELVSAYRRRLATVLY